MKRDLEKCRERLQATHYLTLNLDGHISTSSLHLEARLASIWDETLGQALPLSPARQAQSKDTQTVFAGHCKVGFACRQGKCCDFWLHCP